MKLYDILVICHTCHYKELLPIFTGESEDDLHCEKCSSKDIEIW